MSIALRLFTLFGVSVLLLGSGPTLRAQTSRPVEKPDSTAAAESIPIGYDTTTARTASGTLSTVRPASFNAGILFNPLAAVAGRVPGLFIPSVHGNPNVETAAVLRGWNSLFGSNEPLYVVDGVPGVPIANIAVEDIAQVTLVKEASQAGVYGARAGNGVLLITTKRGQRGRPHLMYHGYTGVAQAARRPDVLTADEYREAMRQLGRESDFADEGADVDWFAEVTRPALLHNHQLGVAGGAGPVSYQLSGGFLNGQGVVRLLDLERLNGRFNADARLLRNRLHLAVSASAMRTTRHDLPENLFARVLQARPTNPVYNPNGSYFTDTSNAFLNPVALLERSSHERRQREWFGNFRARYTFLAGLSASAGYAVRKNREEANRTRAYPLEPVTTYQGSTDQENTHWLDLSVQYHKRLARHSLGVQLGGLNQYTRLENAFFVGAGSGGGGGPAYEGGRNVSSATLRTYSAQFSYSFADAWLAHVNVVRQGVADFGGSFDARWLPSASVAWVLDEGQDWSGNALLNGLKWRLHWGKSTTTGVPTRQYIFGLPGTVEKHIVWPLVTSYGTGFDFTLLKNKLHGSLDGYVENSRQGDFVRAPIMPTPVLVLARYAIRNVGLELSLRAALLAKRGFTWEAAFAGAVNGSTITESSLPQFDLSAFPRGPLAVARQGEPAGILFGMQVDRVDNGFPVYRDQNRDGTPEWVALGNVQPALTASLNNAFTLAGRVDVNITCIAVAGNRVFDAKRITLATPAVVPVFNISPEALQYNRQALMQPSDLFVSTGSFVRLDNIATGYTFARNGRLFHRARVYLAGRNVFKFSPYPGTDPDEGVRGVSTFENFYPVSRSFTAGLDLQF